MKEQIYKCMVCGKEYTEDNPPDTGVKDGCCTTGSCIEIEAWRKRDYYVPDISEFHVGFECERIGMWLKYAPFIYSGIESLTNDSDTEGIGSIEEDIKDGEIRIKFLDKEDIESLEWKYRKTEPGLNRDIFIKQDHELDYDYDTNYLIIEMIGEGDVIRFSGTINNKSELKKLFKQLGI